MTIAIALISLLAVVYAYFGYPFILLLLEQDEPQTEPADGPRSFTVIVAARNEEGVIAEKLVNTLALVPPGDDGFVEVLVASDCSDDRTDEIVKTFPNVRLVRSEERKGKEWVQSLAVKEAKGEIIVFTDAKVRLEPDALHRFSRWFANPAIGAVSSIDRVDAPEGGGSGEGFYVRYEMWLRRHETNFRTVIGLSGSCFAVRRSVAAGMRTDIPSDFALLIAAVKSGSRGVLAPDIVCTYRALKTEEEEFHRKVRTIVRGIRTLFDCAEVMNIRKFGSFAWQVISHKLMRWLVPWFFLLATFFSIAGASDYFLLLLIADAFLLFYLAALFGYSYPSLRRHILFKIPLFFVVTNAAVAAAWIRFLRGEHAVSWTPSQKI